ncbi:hypothetical protein MCOR29_000295 [Pyricularia oryzae]|nr:hypothetical protein MCOR01_000078 [Pyricularia oryzae]KAI6336134.1 hypothetical protein MCOR29_000295 [Pyricularia oryzae]KAI6602797.1 hypothetical protein MCOR12_003524 [Pyricularia oryzae]
MEPLPRSTWLIDVHEGCIVDGGGGEEYVTLSYVRGPGSNYLSTNEENIPVLSQPGALFERHDATPAELPAPALASQKLPKTWRDAIHLTRLLGFGYLWVDLLCQVQNQPHETTQQELCKIPYIISGAVFTMAEVDGDDAHYGLRGIKELPEPIKRSLAFSDERIPQQDYEEYEVYRSNLQLNTVATLSAAQARTAAAVFGPQARAHWKGLHQDGRPRPWGNRIWTYSVEFQFSRRMLVFEGGTVRWICHSWPASNKFECPTNTNISHLEHMSESCAHVCHKRHGCRLSTRRLWDALPWWKWGRSTATAFLVLGRLGHRGLAESKIRCQDSRRSLYNSLA